MAHKWTNCGTAWNGKQRHCAHCNKKQAFICIGGDRLNGWKYGWQPLAGRCINHNNAPPAKNQNAILDALVNGPLHREQIAKQTNLSVKAVASTLTILRKKNKVCWLIENDKRKVGWWKLK